MMCSMQRRWSPLWSMTQWWRLCRIRQNWQVSVQVVQTSCWADTAVVGGGISVQL